MNRANQQALFQQTNQGLLGIRQSEVNYYQNLNVAFGTQAALIGGFTYGVFTQNQINYSNEYETEDYIADVYWILSATTIAMSVHVILCTMLMQVLGPGLALHGPVGSMARATEGMRLEQQQIITSFVAMMIMFSLSTVLSCWVVMSMEGAIGCSIAFAIAACYWYKYCERIYLRFYWNPEESGWNTGESSDDLKERNPTEEDDAIHLRFAKDTLSSTHKASPRAPFRRKWLSGFFRRSSLSRAARQEAPPTESNRSRLGSSGSVHSANTAVVRNRLGSSDSQHGGGSVQTQHWAAASARRGVLMEGYLTKLGGGNTSRIIDFRKEPWERRYFTLTNAANLFIYQNRHEYRNDPKNPIFTRPLRLYDYYIEVSNSDNSVRALWSIDERERSSTLSTNDNDIPTMDDSPVQPCLFQMTLILRENIDEPDGADVIERSSPSASRRHKYRDHWVLRCDTEEELQQWITVIKDICPSCLKKF